MRFKKPILFFVLSFVSLSFFRATPAQAVSDKIYKELAKFSKVIEIVDEMYVEEVDEKVLIDGAIRGMLHSLDPHTVYFTKEVYKNFNSDTKGRFGGVGIEVTVKDGILTVVSPLQNTPAWDAGVKAGDKIIAIDGQSTKNIGLGEAVIKMRGSIGKKVTLTLWRNKKTKVVQLVRELIRVPSVELADLGEGLVHIKIISFQQGVSKAFKQALDKYRKTNGPIKGIVLDVRDNPGGLLGEAVKISDLFLKKGVIVSTKGRFQPEEIKRAKSGSVYESVPVVVMINGGSASASEIVAGALKDQGRATLVGTKSFGKGSVQTVFTLDNGDAIKITIAHYYTPKNRLIDGKGIMPDLLVDQKSFKKRFKKKVDAEGKEQEFTRQEYLQYQLDEAVAYLKKK